MDVETGRRLLALRARIVAEFDNGNWEELGLLTGSTDLITGHTRLLRSLAWGDQDYAGNALTVLRTIVETSPAALPVIESYLNRTFPNESTFISAKPAELRGLTIFDGLFSTLFEVHFPFQFPHAVGESGKRNWELEGWS